MNSFEEEKEKNNIQNNKTTFTHILEKVRVRTTRLLIWGSTKY